MTACQEGIIWLKYNKFDWPFLSFKRFMTPMNRSHGRLTAMVTVVQHILQWRQLNHSSDGGGLAFEVSDRNDHRSLTSGFENWIIGN